jgi:D-alanyl-D-alanine carboxypeptidase/D-alanyl-D-alanine-endopeptidase (penicillin-binding protein 4)
MMKHLFSQKRFGIILLVFFLNGTFPSVTGAVEAAIMEKEIEQYLARQPNLKGAIAGISIRSARTGELLYEHNGDTRLQPASNVKLLTGAAALAVLGENYRFRTEMYMDGPLKGNTLHGNLYIKGKGDPTLLKADFDQLAKKIRAKGIKVIKGHLIGDDRWYDDNRYSADLPWSDEQWYYGAQISALTAAPDDNYDSGTVIMEIVAGKEIASPVEIRLIPNTDYIRVINHSVTVSPDGEKELTIKRKHGANVVTVEGTFPINMKEKEWIAVWEPTGYALDLFRKSLAKQGIVMTGTAKTGETPEKAQHLFTHFSMPLSEILVPFMKMSNNTHAEVLVKEMGKVVKGEGSWDKGLEVLDSQLRTFGLNTNSMVLRDGSGISHANLVPANELTKLLFQIQKEKWFPSFLNSLPVSGKSTKMEGGTLRRRMKSKELNGKVRAKTGTIRSVSSLSGYVETKSGETLIFAILLNNLVDESIGKGIEEEIVQLLCL